MRLATFNVQNLRLRGQGAKARFDGALDRNSAEAASGPDPELDAADRLLTARVIAESQADILALQEVFDQRTLDAFHKRLLEPLGARYPHRLCLEGNDGRSQDVAVLSRWPIEEAASAAHLTFADLGIAPPPGFLASQRLFRRDCLSVKIAGLWLFVCHLKSDGAEPGRSAALRRAEATGIRRLIERRFKRPQESAWAILGDVNVPDTAQGGLDRSIDALLGGFAVDLMARIADPAQRWTHYHPDGDVRSCPDRILLSPGLALANPHARPHICRKGLPLGAGGPDERFAETGEIRPRASDHALVWVDLGAMAQEGLDRGPETASRP